MGVFRNICGEVRYTKLISVRDCINFALKIEISVAKIFETFFS